MKQRKYIRPQTKVRILRFTLLNDVSTPDAGWGNAKRNSFQSDFEIQLGIDELDKMFE